MSRWLKISRELFKLATTWFPVALLKQVFEKLKCLRIFALAQIPDGQLAQVNRLITARNSHQFMNRALLPRIAECAQQRPSNLSVLFCVVHSH